MPTPTLAFLQNQWFKDPERMQGIYERQWKGRRNDFISTFLFFGCLTGKRIQKAFGKAIDDIIWEEVSPKIGSQASACFPPDPEHMTNAIEIHKPEILLCFGRIARNGVSKLSPKILPKIIIGGPHPAARHAGVVQELENMAREYFKYSPKTPM